MAASTAETLADILADGTARAATFGFDSPLVTRRFAAVKTGTSKDMRDNWCIGFTPRYTVGVWVGNANGQPMQGVSGVAGAAPVWRQIVDALPAAPAPAAKPNAVGQGVKHAALAAFTIEPITPGSVLALDPDMPLHVQQLLLRGPAGQWLMDGLLIGRGSSVRWRLTPGRHRLEVLGAERQVLDSVQFEVRWGVRPVRPQKG